MLLVAFHAIGSRATSGLHVANASFYREFANIFVHIRMPLFTFLSGFVYAYWPVLSQRTAQFALKKVRRLAVPSLVATTITYVMHLVLEDSNKAPAISRIWEIYVFPYEHFWFVQALLLIFLVVILLENSGALRSFPRFLLVMVGASMLYRYTPFESPSLLSAREATLLLPFFLVGLAANRFRAEMQSRAALWLAVLCFVPAQAFHTYSVLTQTPPAIDSDRHRTLLALVIGISANICVINLVPSMRWFAAIGKPSYPIYLYHPIFIAGARVVGLSIVAMPTALVFIACVAAGIAGPMLMRRFAIYVPGSQLLLEGKGRRPAPRVGALEIGETSA